MTAIPVTIQVGPMRYSLTVDQAAMDRRAVVAEKSLLGSTNNDVLSIVVAPGLPRDSEADTVLHEVLHAVLHQASTGLGYDKEERLIRALCPLLLDTMRRNPSLVAYLMDTGEAT